MSDLATYRYRSQLLARTPFERPADTVAWFGAMQAQDYAAALWAVGQRTRGASERRVEQALAERAILRTWPLRGTLHFVAADDVRWLLALLGPRVIARSARRFAQLGLDEGTIARARAAFERALVGGQRLTRPELRQVLEDAGVASSGQRGYQLLWRFAVEGLICLAARRGKQQTFALLDEWVPPGRSLSGDAALAELAARYFRAHGPATAHDLAWWAGLTVGEARRAVRLAGDALIPTDAGGATFWSVPGSPAPRVRPAGARLLPAFDEYLVGYRDRDAVLDPTHARRVNAGGGLLGATVVLDGRVAGTWKRTVARDRVSVRARLFRNAGATAVRALEAAAEAYGRFLGVAAECSIEED